MKERVVAFDLGLRNFAYMIEEFSLASLKKGLKTPEICKIGKVVDYSLIDFEKNKYDMDVRIDLLNFLNGNMATWAKCQTVLIEEQYNNPAGGANTKMIKMSEFILSFFMSRFPNAKIMLFPSRLKTQRLNSLPGLDQKERKRWAINEALIIAQERNDEELYSLFKTDDKLDDLADAFLIIQAYKVGLTRTIIYSNHRGVEF